MKNPENNVALLLHDSCYVGELYQYVSQESVVGFTL